MDPCIWVILGLHGSCDPDLEDHATALNYCMHTSGPLCTAQKDAARTAKASLQWHACSLT